MRNTALIILLQLLVMSLFSQQVTTVKGIIIDKNTGERIENAYLSFPLLESGSTTNSKGEFTIENVICGKQWLIVKHLSYHDYTQEIDVATNLNLTIRLEAKSIKLEAILVEQDKQREVMISKIPYIETTIVGKRIQESGASDIGELLRSSNNISGIRKGGTNIDPVVRGFKYSQLNLVLDGGQKIEGGCPNRMDPTLSHIDIASIEKIEVFKGPYALQYGPSFGGTINLTSKKPIYYKQFENHLSASKGYESNWDGNKENLSIYGGNHFLSYQIYGGQMHYGNYKDGNQQEVLSSFKKSHYGITLGIKPQKKQEIILKYDVSKGRDVRFPTLPMDERKDDTWLGSIDYHYKSQHKYNQSWHLKLYHSDVNHEMDNKNRAVSDTVVTVSKITAGTSGLRLVSSIIPTNKMEIQMGIDAVYISKDGSRTKSMILQPFLPVIKEKLWNQAHILNSGIFVQSTYNYKAWEYQSSIRLDNNRGTSDEIIIGHPSQGEIYHFSSDSINSNFTNFSFNLGISYHITEDLTGSISLGRGSRSPDMIERYIILLPVGYDKYDYLGNPKLLPETNYQLDLTISKKEGNWGLIQVNGFYSIIDDYITGKRLPPAIQKPLTKGVLGVKKFENTKRARMRGFEFLYASPADYNLGIEWFASYTYGTIDEGLFFVMNEQGEVIEEEKLFNDALAEIAPFETSIHAHYNFIDKRFIPKFSLRLVSPQNHISQIQSEKTSPGFILANFSFSYLFNSYLSFNGGVNNIFDTPYFEHLNRNIIGANKELFESGRSFRLSLHIKI